MALPGKLFQQVQFLQVVHHHRLDGLVQCFAQLGFAFVIAVQVNFPWAEAGLGCHVQSLPG